MNTAPGRERGCFRALLLLTNTPLPMAQAHLCRRHVSSSPSTCNGGGGRGLFFSKAQTGRRSRPLSVSDRVTQSLAVALRGGDYSRHTPAQNIPNSITSPDLAATIQQNKDNFFQYNRNPPPPNPLPSPKSPRSLRRRLQFFLKALLLHMHKPITAIEYRLACC